ncbi:MAG TPA: heavy metal translocating P-type ATPase metal-binding domain-containing protein [Flavobacterium sp.]|uniref:heavy metal translocating P-type ATPase n=1 Tax=Flavobacterium sp. TaxID=239 RepID=UPI002CF6F01D|nr:heavy metal translocating P-type ATPase metal-binding domain-containing protein [Flavobacterium sp.]HNP33734.1 heavy metal translocating P-type ATPase metal-binding domain-containing protein [Flavobacterium sp.]
MSSHQCFHCGQDIAEKDTLFFDEKAFCCKGCETVYEIFSLNGLSTYYDIEHSPGSKPFTDDKKYNFLDNQKIVEGLLEFSENGIQIVSLSIPNIHCSSCIWILENLRRIEKGVVSSQVNFHQKKVRINFNPDEISLKKVVLLLASIGYEPYISLEDYDSEVKTRDRSLVYKLAVAFFCFGNIMLLSFPEYFEHKEFWLDHYKVFFRWLMLALSLPSFLYSASGYYIAAWNNLRAKIVSIEIPIALGIIVMFIRSLTDVLLDRGPGFFDSMTGLIFFMLLGKMFQLKTYKFLNFERDFKSYFPIAVTRVKIDGKEENVSVYEINKGDRILIRNHEIIPADGILMSEKATIDYSFVTGEAVPVSKRSGDKIFAGGRLSGAVIEIEVLKPVSQSYLTQLWSNEAFQKKEIIGYKNITDRISRYFTPILLLISVSGFGYWIFINTDTAFNVFTAVLIVACPCALALTAPFTLGNILRILGRSKFYLKNALVIEQMAKINTIVFDKTGTITTNKSAITYEGTVLNKQQEQWVRNLLRASNHPLSRMLYAHLPDGGKLPVSNFEETTGKGITGEIEGHVIKIGASSFVGSKLTESTFRTSVNVSVDGVYFGKFILHNEYRQGLAQLFDKLHKKYTIKILSGDNEGERTVLQDLLPKDVELVFNQNPEEKLGFIKTLQQNGHKVMMIGDGLNDAGALRQADIGVAISENVNVFSPACDAILDAGEFEKLELYLALSSKAIKVIKMSFTLSFLYNIVGLSFAVTGNLLPIVAAIIMPLSTITIISFVTIMGNFYAYRLKVMTVKKKYDEGHILSKVPTLILNQKIPV